jgi:glycogen synthase
MDRVATEMRTHASVSDCAIFNGAGSDLYRRGGILAISEHIVDEIRRMSGIVFEQGVKIVPAWAKYDPAYQRKPYLRDGKARFVMASTIQEHKGVDIILDACAALKRRFPDFKVDFYGDGNIPVYTDKTKILGISDICVFHGMKSQAELQSLYADYDAFLFPTWAREPQAFAPIEALSCGVPAIMTDDCGNAETLIDGYHCIKIPRNAEALAKAMADVIEGRVDLDGMGRRGRELVRTALDFEIGLSTIERTLAKRAGRWDHAVLDDGKLENLSFVKHNLATSLRFG